MNDDLRAVLEAIAFGEDPRVTPSDRLRAIEQLAQCDDALVPAHGFLNELGALEGHELDRCLDAHLADQIAADVFGEAKRWPVLAQLVDRELEGRARTLAKELHVAQVEVEIDRRVQERLCQLATADPMQPADEKAPVAQNSPGQGALAEWPSGRPRLRSESGLRRSSRAA